MTVPFVQNDGGRSAAGYRGVAGDCVARAFALASERPYEEVYALINELAENERRGRRKRGRSTARSGVHKRTIRRLGERLGFIWHTTMEIGTGCRIHIREEELPRGRLVLSLSRHVAAYIDGVLHDTHDCSRGGTRCVYGYWRRD